MPFIQSCNSIAEEMVINTTFKSWVKWVMSNILFDFDSIYLILIFEIDSKKGLTCCASLYAATDSTARKSFDNCLHVRSHTDPTTKYQTCTSHLRSIVRCIIRSVCPVHTVKSSRLILIVRCLPPCKWSTGAALVHFLPGPFLKGNLGQRGPYGPPGR